VPEEVLGKREVIPYGSIQLMKWLIRHSNVPTWYDDRTFNFSFFHAYLYQWALNYEIMLLPFSALIGQLTHVFDLFGTHFFIRPNSGTKLFSGFVYNSEDKTSVRDLTDLVAFVPPEELVVIGRFRPPEREVRFFINIHDNIAYSVYPPGKEHISVTDEYYDYSSILTRVRRLMRHNTLQVPVVVVDIAIRGDNCYLVELNCANTSGLYLGNIQNFVSGMEEAKLEDLKAEGK
jgi:hypothetical protein